MKLLALIAILATIAYVGYAYLDGSGQLKGIMSNMNKSEETKKATEKAAAIAKVKEIYWARAYRTPGDCAAPSSSLRALECKNQADQMRAQFEKQWTQQLASGWVPPEAKPSP